MKNFRLVSKSSEQKFLYKIADLGTSSVELKSVNCFTCPIHLANPINNILEDIIESISSSGVSATICLKQGYRIETEGYDYYFYEIVPSSFEIIEE